jgi:putative FmdB family regulatory protein
MPMFDYVCKKCDHRFERLVRGRERPKCPKCSSSSLEQQAAVVSFGRVEGVRSLNSPTVMRHLRSLIGDIPTIPKHVTKTSNPGRRSRKSTVVGS